MALRISLNSDGPDKIDKNWISRFLKRHLNVCTKIGRNMDALRVKGTEKEILRKWYSLYQTNIKRVNLSDI
jgi:hypothetical protein